MKAEKNKWFSISLREKVVVKLRKTFFPPFAPLWGSLSIILGSDSRKINLISKVLSFASSLSIYPFSEGKVGRRILKEKLFGQEDTKDFLPHGSQM